jgi:hypothetical protein
MNFFSELILKTLIVVFTHYFLIRNVYLRDFLEGKNICFLFSVDWRFGFYIAFSFLLILTICVFIIQIIKLFHIEDFDLKTKDFIGPIIMAINFITHIVLGLAYGKPYTPIFYSGAGCILTLILSLIYNGLWGWCGIFFSATTPCTI